ncbi:MAG: MBL fold metallo-hydrolase [Proteobacteria bacterium]|nr:MBL fold metallo-hydrolase [Pseudomonadota bacterium]
MPFNLSIIHMPPVGYDTNSVLIDNGMDAVVFDPWGRGGSRRSDSKGGWTALLNDRKLKLNAIYITHGHFDHIMAVPELVAETDTPWYIHPADLPVVEWSNKILASENLPLIDLEKIPPRPLSPGTIEILPSLSATVIHLPGHSAGGVAFYFSGSQLNPWGPGFAANAAPRDDTPLLIVGDTLFQNCYGRTDYPTGDKASMNESLATLYNLDFPDKTRVIHGHGPDTTIGWLRENNSFFTHCKTQKKDL